MMKRIDPKWTALALLALIAALAYLWFAVGFGYFNDDWYEMFAAKAYGSQVFHGIFSIDRPLRAYLMIPIYALFGENPLWYSLSACVLRVLGAWALWWMLDLLWPKAKFSTFWMAVLFVIFPGFTSQPNAIDYQSHIAALALAEFSLALMVYALLRADSVWKRVALLVVSALCGWAYLGLMEYYIGFELIRFLLVLLLALRAQGGWRTRLTKLLRDWLPLALVPVLFVFWRVFIFVGERKATDAGAQLGGLRSAPFETLSQWAVNLFQSVWGVLVVVWWAPLSRMFGVLDSTERWIGLGFVAFAVLVMFLTLRRADDSRNGWRVEALLLGLAIVFAGLLPIILANRELKFPYASRYTLISSTGVVMMVAALVAWVPWKALRTVAFSVLLVLAMLTHWANSALAVWLTESNNNFWWQVSWRIPQLQPGTTLIAHYPLVNAEEDYFVWGPANLIYYPEKASNKEVQPTVFAAIPDSGTMRKVLANTGQQFDKRRTIVTYANYRLLLILTQPTRNACVQVLDGQQLALSADEAENIKTLAPSSDLTHILTDEVAHTPPQIIFGPEPAHTWCYFYQKASLARQRGDWQTVVDLGEQAFAQNQTAADPIEWMPFLQAYALHGKGGRVALIAKSMAAQPAVQAQACQILGKMSGLKASTQKQMQTLFCKP